MVENVKTEYLELKKAYEVKILGCEFKECLKNEFVIGVGVRIGIIISMLYYYVRGLYYVGERILLSIKRIDASNIKVRDDFTYLLSGLFILIIIGIILNYYIYKIYLIEDRSKKELKRRRIKIIVLHTIELSFGMAVFILYCQISLKEFLDENNKQKIVYLLCGLFVGVMIDFLLNVFGKTLALNKNKKNEGLSIERDRPLKSKIIVLFIVVSGYILLTPIMMDINNTDNRIVIDEIKSDVVSESDNYIFTDDSRYYNFYYILYENDQYYIADKIYYNEKTGQVSTNKTLHMLFQKDRVLIKDINSLDDVAENAITNTRR